MGTLAASSRPLKRDNDATPKEIAEMLAREGKRFPWIEFVAVGVDGRTVRRAVPADTAESRISLMGGCVGFAGVIWFNQRLCIFTRPLKAGANAQQQLEATAAKLKAWAEEFMRKRCKIVWRTRNKERTKLRASLKRLLKEVWPKEG